MEGLVFSLMGLAFVALLALVGSDLSDNVAGFNEF